MNQNQSGSNSVGSLDLSKEDTIYGTADAQFVDNAEARKLLLEKDREMAKLRQELAEKEKQLRIQTQVSAT